MVSLDYIIESGQYFSRENNFFLLMTFDQKSVRVYDLKSLNHCVNLCYNFIVLYSL